MKPSEQNTCENKINWSELWDIVQRHNTFILTSHRRPDGDSLGSQLAMAEILERMGKKTLLVNSDPVSDSLAFLDPDKKIHALESLTDEEVRFMEHADCHILVDLSSWFQLNKMEEAYRSLKNEKVIIDHHNANRDVPGTYFLDPNAEATGILVYEAIRALGKPLTERMAFELFVAIATDTGWFRFATVKPRTFEIAADLVRAGVSQEKVYKYIYEQESLGRMLLKARAYQNVERYMDGKLMFTTLMLSDFQVAGADKSESEDIINDTLKIKGAEMAIIMVEQETGGFKISFRSRCNVNCVTLASQFGGGGHPQAAGAFTPEPYEFAKERLLAAVKTEYENACKG